MLTSRSFRLGPVVALPLVVAANAIVAFLFLRAGLPVALLVGLLPVILVALAALVTSDRSVLAFGALGLAVSFHTLNRPLVSGTVWTADVLVGLAVGSWAVARLIGVPRDGHRFGRARTPLLGWPFALFGAVALVAAVRGHERYGASLVGQPLRLVAYAGIALALSDLDSRKAYKGLVVVLYAGAVWMLLNGLFLLATGGSQTNSDVLSTGGTRVLSGTVSLHLAAALFLALLNAGIDESKRRRGLHLAVAGLATLGIVLSFARATFIAVALIVPVLVLFFRRVRSSLVGFLPLMVPVVVGAALALSTAAPQLGPTLKERVNISFVAGGKDESYRWRQDARTAILEQWHESPITGVGFGRGAEFTLNGVQYRITQDPHNSFIWLLAGGGVLLVASFALLLAAFARDVWLRYRQARWPHERVLVAWAGCTLVATLVAASVGPLFGDPTELLSFWLLLVMPTVVRREAIAVRGAGPLRTASAPSP